MFKSLAVLGLSTSMLMGAGAPVFAQAGSPGSCSYLEQNNQQAFAQLCGDNQRETTEFGSPILGGDDAPEVEVHCVGWLLPADFKHGDRIRVAIPIDCR